MDNKNEAFAEALQKLLKKHYTITEHYRELTDDYPTAVGEMEDVLIRQSNSLVEILVEALNSTEDWDLPLE